MGRAKTGSNFTSSKERERREERLEPKERERDGKIVINRRFFMTEEREQRERGRREEGVFFWADRRTDVSG